jgi:mannose-6-phosphate isomerase-like protein (cupin superfamily)
VEAVSGTREGELLERPGRRAWIRTARDELVVVEAELDGRMDGAGPHFHRHHVDSFYVLDGELELTVDGKTVTAVAGTLVVAAPGVVHAFWNASAAPAHYLNAHTPGMRFAEYLRRLDAGEEFDRTEYDMWEVTHPAA